MTPRTSRTITNYGGLDTPQDQNLIQRFCLTCHIERGTSHNSGKLCTQCHYHGSNRL